MGLSLGIDPSDQVFVTYRNTGHLMDATGDHQALIIAALPLSLGVKRHGDEVVDALEQGCVFDALSDTDIKGTLSRDLDNYWSLVLYYNNLKSLGQTHSRIGQEILSTGNHSKKNFTEILQSFAPYSKLYKELDWDGLYEEKLDAARY